MPCMVFSCCVYVCWLLELFVRRMGAEYNVTLITVLVYTAGTVAAGTAASNVRSIRRYQVRFRLCRITRPLCAEM